LSPTEAPPPKVAPAAPEQATANVDPKRAAQLRAAGLEQLNRGAINRAITLLKQANELDPGNTLIKRDLDRALRIARALQAKP
jgi:Flp pilus assembly protein TadD